jgi:hypothetical protein
MSSAKSPKTCTVPPRPETEKGYVIEHRGRYWAVLDGDCELVCLAVYRKGAQEVVRRLESMLIQSS